MMLNKNDQERVTQLLTDAITVLCKNGLSYDSQFCIEGLLGITLDEKEVFLVKIDETVRGHGEGEGVKYKAPTSIARRMAVTSPRVKGRVRGRSLVTTRGRFSALASRKRNLFGVVRPPGACVSNSQVKHHCVTPNWHKVVWMSSQHPSCSFCATYETVIDTS